MIFHFLIYIKNIELYLLKRYKKKTTNEHVKRHRKIEKNSFINEVKKENLMFRIYIDVIG